MITKKIIHVGGAEIGSGFCLIAGPCAVESERQIELCARTVSLSGAKILRGGAFKPRTSPYAFQGLGEEGLRLLSAAAKEYSLACVSEAVSESCLEIVARYCDMIQIGSRNMFNYSLLKAAGRIGKPVLLKRGMAATVEEWLDAAEYLRSEGNEEVVLCERGIRSFDTATRNVLDLGAVCVVRERSELPVICDPSHAAGHAAYVAPLALASKAAGADGVMIEMHPEPQTALSDASQQLTPAQLSLLAKRLLAVDCR